MSLIFLGVGVVVGALISTAVLLTRMRGSDPSIADQRELQIDLGEARERIAELEGALRRARTAEKSAGGSARGAVLEDLVNTLSQPLAFLAVQVAHASGDSPTELTPADLAVTGSRVIQALESFEISVQGHPGDAAEFDPECHSLVTGDIQPGVPVVVLVPAIVGPNGRVARRAVVEPR